MTANMMAGALAGLLALTFGGLSLWDLVKGWRAGEFAVRGPAVISRAGQPAQFFVIVLARIAVVLAMTALGVYGVLRLLGIVA